MSRRSDAERKSAKVAVADDSEPSSSRPGADSQVAEGSRTAQARQKQQLMSVVETPIVNVPLDVMNSNFEEWMKMAMDNVCAHALRRLITYFVLHLSYLRKSTRPTRGISR